MEHIAQFHVGEVITSMQKTSLVPGANDCLIYTTICGIIGILVPFMSRDVYFLSNKLHLILFFYLYSAQNLFHSHVNETSVGI